MNYAKFAYLYDQLMSEAPYDQWVSFIIEAMTDNGISEKARVLDVGCGTGNISIPISKKGYDVTAVDLSSDMLMVAQQKNDQQKANVQFFQQDMRQLTGLGEFELIFCLCDSLNYLHEEGEIIETFQRVFEHVSEDGIFIFDVHSTYKMESIFLNNTFAYNGEEISYIWECFPGEEVYSVEHDLSFFVQTSIGMYERVDELHKQRTYPLSFYKQALEKIGFQIQSVSGDFEKDYLPNEAERWFFVVKKRA